MTAPQDIPLLILAILSLAALIYYAALLFRVAMSRRTMPRLIDALNLTLPDPPPSIAVIVPAHNEAAAIPTLVRSVLAQTYPSFNLILALDRCTDATEARARDSATTHDHTDPRLHIVTIDHCPEDWAGKVHAIHAAYTRSPVAQSADLLLFADADTTFHPDLLRAAAATLHHRNLDLLSLLPTLTTDQLFEQVVQPAAGFELIRRFPIDRLNAGDARIRFANGQFMLFTRSAYTDLGTHAAVKDALLEDLAFARLIHKRKRSLNVLMSDDLLHCRMYDTYPLFRRGWKRIYTESARCRIPPLLKSAWRLRAVGTLLPTAALLTAILALIFLLTIEPTLITTIALATSLLALITFLSAITLIYRTQRAPLHLAPIYPVGAWCTANILAEAARDLAQAVPTEWAGRSYARPIKPTPDKPTPKPKP